MRHTGSGGGDDSGPKDGGDSEFDPKTKKNNVVSSPGLTKAPASKSKFSVQAPDWLRNPLALGGAAANAVAATLLGLNQLGKLNVFGIGEGIGSFAQ